MTRAEVKGLIGSRWAPVAEGMHRLRGVLETVAAPLLDLFIRIWLAQSFFASGVLKTINWPATVFLYTAEHPVPGVSPAVAAAIGTGFELVCPLLLLIGLFTRAAALPLFAWALFLQLTYAALDAQVYQILLLGLLILRGAGSISLDRAIAPHLSSSALPFAGAVVAVGKFLDHWALPFGLLLVRLIVAGVFLHAASVALAGGGAAIIVAAALGLFSGLLAFGLGTRFAAAALLPALLFVPAGSGDDAGLLLGLLLAALLTRGGGALALDRLLAARLVRLFPSLGTDVGWLEGAPRVVIVGAGFGGVAAARALKHAWAQVTLIDRRNYHLFQPLLYQVATASLSPSEIATPIRTLLRGHPNCRVTMARVTGVDVNAREVITADRRIGFDYLVLACGARHSYFSRDDWEAAAPGLKKIDDATAIRARILSAFERAETAENVEERRRLLSFVIVGGGPTGVELAGAIAELARHGMRGDFRSVDPAQARVILVQSASRLLPAMAEPLSARARCSLETLGVEVRTGAKVEEIDHEGVRIGNERIEAATVLWAAGVMASPAARWLGADRDGSGRIVVQTDLSVPGQATIFAIGDTAACKGADGKPLPGLAPVAKQQGYYVARHIRADIEGRRPPGPFRYSDWGSMATIGRKAAVADLRGLHLTGSVAWWLWGAVHVGFLVDARSRAAVLLDWLWSYLTWGRSVRLITGNEGGVD